MVTYKFSDQEQPGCEDIVLTDLTKAYDPDTNRGGWDDGSFTSPNYCIADISAIRLIFNLPDGNVKVINVATGGLYPGLSANPFIRISAADLGYSGSKPDGLVTIRTEITCNKFQGNPISPSVVFYTDLQTIWLCNGWCCLSKLSTKLKWNGKCWTCEQSDLALTVYSMLIQSRQAMNCPDALEAEKFRLKAQEICTANKCNC